MLRVRDLHAYYGKSHILQGVSFDVGAGEIVSLLGRNGVGRSTTLKAVTGEVAPHGAITFKGERIDGRKTHEIARRGVGYVPENRNIFPTLTVRQNLVLGIKDMRAKGRWSIDDMFDMFPNLRERADALGSVISGGEQQMLTMCRTLMGDPDLVMIDEPTEGLAPKLVEQVARPPRRDRPARRVDPAGGAETRHRAGHLAPALRNGPRQDRVRRLGG